MKVDFFYSFLLLLLPLTEKKSFTILALLFRLSSPPSLSSFAIRRSSWCENHSTTTVEMEGEKIEWKFIVVSSSIHHYSCQCDDKSQPSQRERSWEKKVKLFFCAVLKLMRESHGKVSTHNSPKKKRLIGKSIHEQRWRLNRFDDSMRCVNDEEPWRVEWSGRAAGTAGVNVVFAERIGMENFLFCSLFPTDAAAAVYALSLLHHFRWLNILCWTEKSKHNPSTGWDMYVNSL